MMTLQTSCRTGHYVAAVMPVIDTPNRSEYQVRLLVDLVSLPKYKPVSPVFCLSRVEANFGESRTCDFKYTHSLSGNFERLSR